ncbi:molecular chaperone HtpG [Hyphomicrobiales bacterium]|jgi:molecular chaperone HtpG|nr:molecular chaperone HtpG [Rhodobiaceae bacterium]MBT5641249.1 molecular chaperone HtpG [Rhodobiaceae bacterium]MBT6223229.1 molecular chaperone HtpG [Rhodobiaceae bacterium]MDB4128081.1 molecular chaperone HtpG [Hyphomicrobiales bacterium]MDC3272764.1 molecular chaperone HtpG [Hyphomicrobiales bacterium]|tara:strand:- start:217 stop:2124 length:1908 start_codon:yes stop_codon:yes gene_type:complete
MVEKTNNTKKNKKEKKQFGAEVSRLLDILVHSVYPNKEVFLRELISNASDACDKLRYQALTNDKLVKSSSELKIHITVDTKNNELVISDNGIGMSRQEMIDNLGTIAKSGTKEFVDGIKEEEKNISQVGQFGIGFYSAFIVADTVKVISKNVDSNDSWVWISDGSGTFTIEQNSFDTPTSNGTSIFLSLRDKMDEFLDISNIKDIIRTHSDHISFPIEIAEFKEGILGEVESANTSNAIWSKSKSDVTKEEYLELYHSIAQSFDDPEMTIHYKAEGRYEYDVLLFLPSTKPFDLFDPAKRSKLKLYVKKVLISESTDIIPSYFRFVSGVIDCPDIPLTVSRDVLQDNSVVIAIKKAIRNRLISTLSKLSESDSVKYSGIWNNFGAVIKEGLYEDYEKRDDLLKLLRFQSTQGTDLRSLNQYVADMKENQTSIFYITGELLNTINANPQLEGFKARGVEVLTLTDPVDSFWTSTVLGFEGKSFKQVSQAQEELKLIPIIENKDEKVDKTSEDNKNLSEAIPYLKTILDLLVTDVRLNESLVDSPVCLSIADGGVDKTLEKILMERQGTEKALPVLEINPNHSLIKQFSKKLSKKKSKDLEVIARILYDYALIMDGEKPSDISIFGQNLQEILKRSM